MRPRQELTEIFSTFMQFEAERFSRWATDSRLRQSMQNCLKQSSSIPVSKHFWALSWHKNWQDQTTTLAAKHLSAYLQEPCYWAAQETLRKFALLQHGLSDYFQLAIADIDLILKGFKPERGSSLSVYAKLAFSTRLRDLLRQRREIDGVATWTLLRRRVSKKGLIDALHHAGLASTEIDQYWLAWVCFKAVYTPMQEGIKRLPEPDRLLWEAAANLYNTERQHQLAVLGPPCSPEIIEQWMRKAASYMRSYLYPPITSLNLVNQEGQETDLPDPQTVSGLDVMLSEEDLENRFNQRQQVFSLLSTTIEQFDPQMQDVLRRYYQQNQTQQQIAAELNTSQPTVVRRLSRARDALLTTLVIWSRDEMNISPTPDLVKDRGTALEEWLRLRYAEQPSSEENAEENDL
ncbi:MAG: sigma-70 family RNA polymerase sigma factor [Stenomitos rutilans HA7619-LM2]|jgi:RNA polymerase sigma factor (sigma-70 family)|nr:sigma-70 family RNA polymerase sigma factor [Stenomitos rutilans HA7619-LM2]